MNPAPTVGRLVNEHGIENVCGQRSIDDDHARAGGPERDTGRFLGATDSRRTVGVNLVSGFYVDGDFPHVQNQRTGTVLRRRHENLVGDSVSRESEGFRVGRIGRSLGNSHHKKCKQDSQHQIFSLK